ELLDGTRADDRRGHPGPGQQPGQRDVGRVVPELGGELLVRLDGLPVLDHALARSPLQRAGRQTLALLAEYAGELTAVERRPRDDADPVLDRGGDHLELDVPVEQVVDALLGHQPEEVPGRGGRLRLGEVPAGEVRRADVPY